MAGSFDRLRNDATAWLGSRALPAALSLMALLSVLGCGQVLAPSSTAEVRIIAASPNAPGIDIYQNTQPLAYNLGFGAFTSYIPMSSGTFSFAANSSGTKTLLTSAQSPISTGSQYSILFYNVEANLQELILTDQGQAAPAGQQSLRFIDVTTRTGPVDLYLVASGTTLTNARPLVTGLVFSTNTGYLNVPNGSYSVVILPTGTAPTPTAATTAATLYSGPTFTSSAGSAHTLVLIDQLLQTRSGVSVVTLTDFISPTATL